MLIKVGIADDHTLFRKSLILMINTFDGIEVILEANNGDYLLKGLEKTKPDVILMDIQMPIMDGLETCKRLKQIYPDIKILIVSQFTSKEHIQKSLQAGAHGFFAKSSDPAQLQIAIKSLMEKGIYFDSGLTPILHDIILNKETAKNPLANISQRELEIIRLASKGLDTNDISKVLFINKRTVETHRRRIMDKTLSRNFMSVILLAIKHGYISAEEL